MTARRLALAFSLLTAAAGAGGAELPFAGAVMVLDGASIAQGFGNNTAQLDAGGWAGNFWQGFIATTGAAVASDDAVSGCLTPNVLSRYDTGGGGGGAGQAAPYALFAAATPGTRKYYFAGFDAIYNDAALAGFTAEGTISQLQALAIHAHGSGAYFVLLTCPILPLADHPNRAAATATIAAVNAAIMAQQQIPADIVLDTTSWLPNQQDATLYQADHIHPTLAGHGVMAARLADALKTPSPVLTPTVIAGVLTGNYARPANRPDLAVTVLESPDLLAWLCVPASRLTTSADGLTVTALADSGMAFLRLRIQ